MAAVQDQKRNRCACSMSVWFSALVPVYTGLAAAFNHACTHISLEQAHKEILKGTKAHRWWASGGRSSRGSSSRSSTCCRQAHAVSTACQQVQPRSYSVTYLSSMQATSLLGPCRPWQPISRGRGNCPSCVLGETLSGDLRPKHKHFTMVTMNQAVCTPYNRRSRQMSVLLLSAACLPPEPLTFWCTTTTATETEKLCNSQHSRYMQPSAVTVYCLLLFSKDVEQAIIAAAVFV